MSEQDPLKVLQEAWQQVEAPPAARELHAEDAATKEAVNWMAQAWQQIEIPAASLPRRRPLLSFRTLLIPGAVAAALIAGAFFILNPQHSHEDVLDFTSITVAHPPTPAITEQPAVTPQASATEQESVTQHLTVTSHPATTPQPSAKLISNTAEKVEILSGRVRLTMLRGQDTLTKPRPADY